MLNIFIEEIVKLNWKNESKLFKEIINENIDKDINIVFNETKNEIQQYATEGIKSKEYSEVIIETMGCSYCNKKDGFCGCSMCDWDSLLIPLMAHMEVLRNRNIDYYIQAVRYSFSCVRGTNVVGNIVEELAIHNAFSDWQVPDELIQKVFCINSVYRKKPLVGILQARADSISVQKIRLWKKVFRKKVSISIGVETSDEWIRNHWLNKCISNRQIEDAFSIVKEQNCNTNANIILGIPGFTEKQSIENFVETIEWLYKNPNIDLITISPLVTRRKTIQGVLSLVEYENSQPITLISMYYALWKVVTVFEGIESKIVLSPPNCHDFLSQNCIYLGGEYSELEEHIISFLKPLIRIGSSKRLRDIKFSNINKSGKYVQYIKLLNKQCGTEEMCEQLKKAAKALGLFFNKNEMVNEFNEEILFLDKRM